MPTQQYWHRPTTNMPSEKDVSPLFSKDNDEDDDNTSAELFRDKVRALLEHFDVDGDDHLSFSELGALQKVTSGELLTEEMYVMACRALDCTPQQGISLEALKLTYAAEGSNLGTLSSRCRFSKTCRRFFPPKTLTSCFSCHCLFEQRRTTIRFSRTVTRKKRQ